MKNLFAILLVGTAIALFQYYIDPTYQETKALRAQEAEYNEALNNTEKVKEIRDQLLSKYNTFSQTDLDRLNKLLPDNVDNVRLIIEIDKIASRHNLDLKDVTVSDSRPRNQARVVAGEGSSSDLSGVAYGTGPVSFSVTGEYAGFLEFLRDVERSLRIMDITDVQVKPAEKDLAYTYTIKLQTYWLKPLPPSSVAPPIVQ
ncbi:type 4a pilus biogenesis protein PilO [bacterium]|nr:type 4a pilus biogenesis protein PilO [bacterium]